MPAVPAAATDLGLLGVILLAKRLSGGRILILRIELRSATMTVRTGFGHPWHGLLWTSDETAAARGSCLLPRDELGGIARRDHFDAGCLHVRGFEVCVNVIFFEFCLDVGGSARCEQSEDK
jgi:hypothetical protein